MPRTVLVTGASGLLGRDVVKAFERLQWKVVGTALTRVNPPHTIKLDLLDKASIISALDEAKPDAVIHCAANRFPDSVAANPAAARALNVESTAALAAETARRGILLVYISTDYVFAGRPGEAPYAPTDTADPPNLYGLTKYEGERAVLAACEGTSAGGGGGGAPLGVVLRVPLLYGHCAADEKTKSAVHALLDVLEQAQSMDAAAPKVKVDSYALRYPTCTEDVGRVVADVAALYLGRRAGGGGGAEGQAPLPEVLHFSTEAKPFTKWDMVRIFAEDILGMSLANLEPHDPSKEPGEAGAVQRPYDTHLSPAGLREIGVDVACQDFVGWWKRELRAFRH